MLALHTRWYSFTPPQWPNMPPPLTNALICNPLPPPAPVPEYVNYRARVRKWSNIQAADRTYTVPSRLIGKEVQIRLYAEHLEVGFAQ